VTSFDALAKTLGRDVGGLGRPGALGVLVRAVKSSQRESRDHFAVVAGEVRRRPRCPLGRSACGFTVQRHRQTRADCRYDPGGETGSHFAVGRLCHRVVGGKFIAPAKIAQSLSRLSAPAGVFAVLGNHDRWYFAKQIENAITGAGISVLEDAAVSVRSRQCEFWLVGLSDFLTGPRDYRAVLAKLPLHEPALAFTHNPDLFPVVPGNVDLIFAGHTHGGQVYFPGIGRLIVPSRYGQRYAMGHIVENGRHLFVSPGLGTSILPVRFLVPPEVSVVTIRSASSGRPS
jgi:hypothetical protein